MCHTKNELRTIFRTHRHTRPPHERAATANGLQTQWENACLFFGIRPWDKNTLPALFVPTSTEPPINTFLTKAPHCLLPVLFTATHTLNEPTWGISHGGTDLVPTPAPWPAQPPFNADTPTPPLNSADIILIPALAVDEDGARLGQGGGWYDRALLHANPDTPIIAAVFDDEFLPGGTIPLEPHDHLINAVITPTHFTPLPVHG